MFLQQHYFNFFPLNTTTIPNKYNIRFAKPSLTNLLHDNQSNVSICILRKKFLIVPPPFCAILLFFFYEPMTLRRKRDCNQEWEKKKKHNNSSWVPSKHPNSYDLRHEPYDIRF